LTPRPRIALVDDDKSVRKALERLLQAAGMEVEAFASGQEFLEALAPGRFDCLLLDLNMPGLTGLDVLKCLKAEPVAPPAIIMTAYDDPATRDQCIAAGARAYLRKPPDSERLLGAIAQAIGL
jgi:CheY-like chemotaxis protein